MTDSRRIRKKIVPGIAISGLILVAVFAVVWSMRPVWHTHVLTSSSFANAKLAVEYPDGWRFQKPLVRFQHVAYMENVGNLIPTRPPIWNDWWTKYVLKLDRASLQEGYISIGFNEEWNASHIKKDPDKWCDSELSMLRGGLSRAYKSVTVTPINQAGDKGYDIEAIQAVWPSMNKNCLRFLLVYRKSANSDHIICYSLQIHLTEENYRRLKPTINEIIRRLRLVEDNGILPYN